MTLVGCWAHVRRKFVEAVNVMPATRKKGDSLAHVGLNFCDALFRIERDLRDVTPEERRTSCQEHSVLILEKFRARLDDIGGKRLPKSVFGTAVTLLSQPVVKLTNFLKDSRLESDNNRSECAI